MKAFQIALIAVLANVLILAALLICSNLQNPDHLGNINWTAFGPIDVLYALLVAAVGWLMGSVVNGLLVYPKRRVRNYWISQLNVGILFLLAAIYFCWSTGSFEPGNRHIQSKRSPQDMTLTNSQNLYKNVVNRGFRAF